MGAWHHWAAGGAPWAHAKGAAIERQLVASQDLGHIPGVAVDGGAACNVQQRAQHARGSWGRAQGQLCVQARKAGRGAPSARGWPHWRRGSPCGWARAGEKVLRLCPGAGLAARAAHSHSPGVLASRLQQGARQLQALGGRGHPAAVIHCGIGCGGGGAGQQHTGRGLRGQGWGQGPGQQQG